MDQLIAAIAEAMEVSAVEALDLINVEGGE